MSDAHSDEELFSRKERRAHKKLASAQDRSKFKKSDRPKEEAKAALRTEQLQAKRELQKGRVLSITPESIWVDVEGKIFPCFLRGALKKIRTRTKNLVVVGDIAWIEMQDEKSAALTYVEERYSLLARQEHTHRRQQQLIAANIDQALITSSAKQPTLKPALIDRYIIAAQKGNMSPVIVINKIDLCSTLEEREYLQKIIETYTQLSLQVLCVSAKSGEGIDTLKESMQNRASVFVGQSGVGKSSLINHVTGLDLAIGDLIAKTQKGSHTTSSAHLIPLEGGGWCIDTPGIRSFGVWNLTDQDLRDYFPEIAAYATYCKYPNCSHSHEPHCAVQEALLRGELSPLRYESHRKLYLEKEEGLT